uniref:Uncharacterized protein n=1 Tax=Anopheles atroparvus TaxID=41427 RepID=A0AAG5DVJ6_ANOAO
MSDFKRKPNSTGRLANLCFAARCQWYNTRILPAVYVIVVIIRLSTDFITFDRVILILSKSILFLTNLTPNSFQRRRSNYRTTYSITKLVKRKDLWKC